MILYIIVAINKYGDPCVVSVSKLKRTENEITVMGVQRGDLKITQYVASFTI